MGYNFPFSLEGQVRVLAGQGPKMVLDNGKLRQICLGKRIYFRVSNFDERQEVAWAEA